MTDRSAVDTIRGYFYQFDYSILKVLQLSDLDESIAIECIEDIDIHTATELTAVQCKYYAGTEYNHSVIKPAVMGMLSHFKTIKASAKPLVKYSLHGHYSNGQHKLRLPIDVEFLIQHFLTYSEKKVEYRYHEKLGLSDADLREFLSVLDLNINAVSFAEQFADIIRQLQTAYDCTPFTAEYFYYNNALAVIRGLSIEPQSTNRMITKRGFLRKVDTSSVLFNEWFVQKKGKRSHFAALRKEYFADVNLSPFERFFLIEVDPSTLVRSDLKDLLYMVSRKWSKTSKRDGNSSFCPYVYVHGLPAHELVALKKELSNEGVGFIDGYDFYGADFNVKSIARPATYHNGIKLKFLNSIDDVTATVDAVTNTRRVYEFHLGKNYFDIENKAIKHVKIQVEQFADIKEII